MAAAVFQERAVRIVLPRLKQHPLLYRWEEDKRAAQTNPPSSRFDGMVPRLVVMILVHAAVAGNTKIVTAKMNPEEK